jgi:hypothetical protein
MAVDPFGRDFKKVHVNRFVEQKPSRHDFSRQFAGLTGTLIPYGSYVAQLEADGIRVADVVHVDKTVVFAVISGNGEFIDVSPGMHRVLRAQLESVPVKMATPVWVRLTPLYSSEPNQTAVFDSNNQCVFYDVSIGSYIGILMNHGAVVGLAKIDVKDTTESVSFRLGVAPELIGPMK